jgi:tetratricopeptide (TPR) repeat protein
MNIKKFISEKSTNRAKNISKVTVIVTVILLVLYNFGLLQNLVGSLSSMISPIPDNKFALSCLENAAEHGNKTSIESAAEIGTYYIGDGLSSMIENVKLIAHFDSCANASTYDSLVLKREEVLSKVILSYKEAIKWCKIAGLPEKLGESYYYLGELYYFIDNFEEALNNLANEWLEESVYMIEQKASILNMIALLTVGGVIAWAVMGTFEMQDQITSNMG